MNLSRAKSILQRHGAFVLRGKSNMGYCHVCRRKTLFVEHGAWLRDEYFCARCESIPRQRALMKVLNEQFPNWPELVIHESSPAGSSSQVIKSRCGNYACSFYWEDIEPGKEKEGVRCENLEAMTFANESFDLFITQDVFEHVLRPDKAFAEVARVLKPGGAHVFTVPIYAKEKTLIRAIPGKTDNGIEHLEAPDYHGNPIDPNGSLVIREWGRDLPDYIKQSSGLESTIYNKPDRSLGLTGEFLDVVVSRKMA